MNKWQEKTYLHSLSHQSIINLFSFIIFTPFYQIYKILIHLLFSKKHKLRYRKQGNKMNFSTSSTEQLKIIATVLCKMGKFLNEMTEQCLLQLSETDPFKYKQRMLLNRENIRNIQNSKNIQKLKAKDDNKAKVNGLQKIKNLKPKHPVSSFFFFYREKGQEIAKEKGEILGSKIAKIVGELWKGMNESQRQPYQKKARQTRQKYEEEMANYKLKYSDQIAKLKKYKREIKQAKKQKKEASMKSSDLQYKNEQNLPSNEDKQVIEDKLEIEQQSVVSVSDEMSDSLDSKSEESSENANKQASESSDMQDELKDLSQIQMDQLQTLVQKQQDQKEEKIIEKQQLPQYESIQEQTEAERAIIGPNKGTNRPKGPISSFFLFYKIQGKRLSQENKLPLGPKTIKLASQIWKKMNPSEKQKYGLLSELSRQKCNQQMQEIKNKYGDAVLLHKEEKISNTSPKGKKGRKSKVVQLNE